MVLNGSRKGGKKERKTKKGRRVQLSCISKHDTDRQTDKDCEI